MRVKVSTGSSGYPFIGDLLSESFDASMGFEDNLMVTSLLDDDSIFNIEDYFDIPVMEPDLPTGHMDPTESLLESPTEEDANEKDDRVSLPSSSTALELDQYIKHNIVDWGENLTHFHEALDEIAKKAAKVNNLDSGNIDESSIALSNDNYKTPEVTEVVVVKETITEIQMETISQGASYSVKKNSNSKWPIVVYKGEELRRCLVHVFRMSPKQIAELESKSKYDLNKRTRKRCASRENYKDVGGAKKTRKQSHESSEDIYSSTVSGFGGSLKENSPRKNDHHFKTPNFIRRAARGVNSEPRRKCQLLESTPVIEKKGRGRPRRVSLEVDRKPMTPVVKKALNNIVPRRSYDLRGKTSPK